LPIIKSMRDCSFFFLRRYEVLHGLLWRGVLLASLSAPSPFSKRIGVLKIVLASHEKLKKGKRKMLLANHAYGAAATFFSSRLPTGFPIPAFSEY
jgi:hypothetical protein